jgi:hypothetical protein
MTLMKVSVKINTYSFIKMSKTDEDQYNKAIISGVTNGLNSAQKILSEIILRNEKHTKYLRNVVDGYIQPEAKSYAASIKYHTEIWIDITNVITGELISSSEVVDGERCPFNIPNVPIILNRNLCKF